MTSHSRPIEEAPLEGRRLLGALLGQRRIELGYAHWPAFARERLPLTPSGNPNTRILADLEQAYRASFPEPRLRQLAQAYMVTYESLVAVAHLRAGVLEPALPPAPRGTITPLPPMTSAARIASDREYFRPLSDRRSALAARGITDPTGAQMFPGSPEDAQAWDGIGSRMDIYDRMWFLADLQRRAAARDGNSAGNGEPESSPG